MLLVCGASSYRALRSGCSTNNCYLIFLSACHFDNDLHSGGCGCVALLINSVNWRSPIGHTLAKAFNHSHN